MTSVPRLPNEITNKIIDEVAELSFESLKACALVSRSWAPRSQYHALSRIRFEGNRGFNKWYSHILKHAGPDGPSCHVTCINYDCYTRPAEQKPRSLHKDSDNCLPYFTRVHTLYMGNADFQHMPNFAVLGSAIRTIGLHNCRMDVDGLLTLLRSFTRLEVLMISNPRLLETKRVAPSVIKLLTRLKGQPKPSPVTPLPLREVTLSLFFPHYGLEYDCDEVHRLKSFLALSGGTLTVLRINSDWGPLNLREMKELTRVDLGGPRIDRNLATLGTLSSSKLTTIRLNLPMRYIACADEQASGWEQLDHTLEGLHNRINCNPLRFCVYVDDLEGYEEELETDLPRLIPRFIGHGNITIEIGREGRWPAGCNGLRSLDV